MKKVKLVLVLGMLLAGSCTSITRVENFKEHKNKSATINYKDEQLKLHTNILINNGKEKHYAHGLFHIPLFPTIFFGKDGSSLENNIMVVVTILGPTRAKALIKNVVVNGTVKFENLIGECRPGGNFVRCYFKIPFTADDAKDIHLNGFVYTINGSNSSKRNFQFKKDDVLEWRFIRGDRYPKR